MADRQVYIHAAAALGPCGDTMPAERITLNEDPPPYDCRELVKRVVGVPLRQASHLVELAAIGSQLCLQRLATSAAEDSAVYLGTGLAEVRKTNALFFQVMPPGPGLASPFDFINAANNMAAFYTAKLGNFRSRNLTVTQEEFSFEWALKLAFEDLRDGGFQSALVGGVDENAHPRSRHMRRIALAPEQVMGEGSGWLYLSTQAEHAIGEILGVEDLGQTANPVESLTRWLARWQPPREPAVLLPGFRVRPDDLDTLRAALPGFEVRHYLPACGCFHTAAAFGLGSIFDTPGPGLIVHVNRRPAGHWMAIAARTFATATQN